MAKQQSQIQMGAYFQNGRRYNNPAEGYTDEFTPFDGYPTSFDVWNVNYKADKEFLTSPASKSLSGYERGNPGGFRLQIDIALRNTTNAQTSNIKSLLDLVPSQYERFVVATNINGSPSYNVTANVADIPLGIEIVNNSNSYQGAYVRNIDQNDTTFRCTRYFTSGVSNPQTMRVQGNVNAVSWADGNSLNIVLYPDKPTVIGVSVDNTTSNIIYCNLISSSLGIERELTIGNQIINMSLRSVDRFQTIPSYLAI